jgi:hypothetical protein
MAFILIRSTSPEATSTEASQSRHWSDQNTIAKKSRGLFLARSLGMDQYQLWPSFCPGEHSNKNNALAQERPSKRNKQNPCQWDTSRCASSQPQLKDVATDGAWDTNSSPTHQHAILPNRRRSKAKRISTIF